MAYRETSTREAWVRENSILVAVRINKRQDPDLYNYFRGVEERGESKGAIAREALNEYLQNHK